MLRKTVRTIIMFFIIIVISLLYSNVSFAIDWLGSSWDKDGDGRETDKDIALWTSDAGWFNDTGGWAPSAILGKSVHFYSAAGSSATIAQRGAMCVGHINSKLESRTYYTITNIVDVDTTSVINKNNADGNSGWAGWPGGVISYGHSSNGVLWPTSNSGAAAAGK